MDFSMAFSAAKYNSAKIRRVKWKPNKYVHIRPNTIDSLSYPELVYTDKSESAPWTPNRCDLLENDWIIL